MAQRIRTLIRTDFGFIGTFICSSEMENTSAPWYEDIEDEIRTRPFTFVTSVISVIGIILNTLVIIVIVYGQLMRKSVFMMLLLILAMADTMSLCMASISAEPLYNLLPYSSSIWLCRCIIYLLYVSITLSSWLIALLTVERAIAVIKPLLKFTVHTPICFVH